MNPVLLFRGGGNWLPFLFILVALFLLVKGVEWLVRRYHHRRRHRKQLHPANDHPANEV